MGSLSVDDQDRVSDRGSSGITTAEACPAFGDWIALLMRCCSVKEMDWEKSECFGSGGDMRVIYVTLPLLRDRGGILRWK